MWKYLLITMFLVFAVIAVHAGDDDDENLNHRDIREVFTENIRRKCLKVNNMQIYKHAMDAFNKCHKHKYNDSPETEEQLYRLVCKSNCTENFIKEVESCLSIEEQYLPDFVFSIKEKHCKDYSKVLQDKTKGHLQVECVRYMRYMWYMNTFKCFGKLKFLHHKSDPEFVLSLREVCSDVKTYHDCILEVLPRTCGSDYAKYVIKPYLNRCKLNGFKLQ